MLRDDGESHRKRYIRVPPAPVGRCHERPGIHAYGPAANCGKAAMNPSRTGFSLLLLSLPGERISHGLNRLRKKDFILSFRAKRGISLRSKSNIREIPRRKTCLGMTTILFFPQPVKPVLLKG